MSETYPLCVAVIGGGLAGMAAAAALSREGVKVVLLESRATLGGRATSYTDAATGETIDNCQHVAMGCCTNLAMLSRMLGIADQFEAADSLTFVSGSDRHTSFAAGPLPAPFHLTASFLRLPWLTLREKWLFASAVRNLAQSSQDLLRGINFQNWLRQQNQTENLIRNVWELVLVSALSESLDRTDAAYARKVFVDGFLSHRVGWKVMIPKVPLGELFSQKGAAALRNVGVEIRTRQPIGKLTIDQNSEAVMDCATASEVHFSDIVLSVPWHQLGGLLPDDGLLAQLRQQADSLESAPITSVHLWFDRKLCDLPHAVFVDRLSQWMFSRGLTPDGRHLYQVVISNSRHLKGMASQEVINKVSRDLQEAWPSTKPAELLHARVITERRAVFAVTPGVDDLRPAQQTPIPNLQVAGDWTQTGWPATMESAVKSGFLAAENILRRHGKKASCAQPGLPVSIASRWLFGIQDHDEKR